MDTTSAARDSPQSASTRSQDKSGRYKQLKLVSLEKALVSAPAAAQLSRRQDGQTRRHHNRQIVRQPISAFGNSDGDLQMLQWTAAGSGVRFMGLVYHTDAERWRADAGDGRAITNGREKSKRERIRTVRRRVSAGKNPWRKGRGYRPRCGDSSVPGIQ